MEAALKLKETCGLQAEAFSGAELRHGRWRWSTRHPLLIFARAARRRPGCWSWRATCASAARGFSWPRRPAPRTRIAAGADRHEDLTDRRDPVLLPDVEQLARERGLDPDAPRHLAKVTRTR